MVEPLDLVSQVDRVVDGPLDAELLTVPDALDGCVHAGLPAFGLHVARRVDPHPRRSLGEDREVVGQVLQTLGDLDGDDADVRDVGRRALGQERRDRPRLHTVGPGVVGPRRVTTEGRRHGDDTGCRRRRCRRRHRNSARPWRRRRRRHRDPARPSRRRRRGRHRDRAPARRGRRVRRALGRARRRRGRRRRRRRRRGRRRRGADGEDRARVLPAHARAGITRRRTR